MARRLLLRELCGGVERRKGKRSFRNLVHFRLRREALVDLRWKLREVTEIMLELEECYHFTMMDAHDVLDIHMLRKPVVSIKPNIRSFGRGPTSKSNL